MNRITFSREGEIRAGAVVLVGLVLSAVLGNTLGFYMSYRRYDPRALVKFLGPAAGFFVAFMIPPVWGLLAGGTVAAFAVASVLIAVTALLALRPDQLATADASFVEPRRVGTTPHA